MEGINDTAKSEILKIRRDKLQSKGFSVCLSSEEAISVLLLVTKARNGCNTLLLKATEDKEEETTCKLVNNDCCERDERFFSQEKMF